MVRSRRCHLLRARQTAHTSAMLLEAGMPVRRVPYSLPVEETHAAAAIQVSRPLSVAEPSVQTSTWGPGSRFLEVKRGASRGA